MKISCGLAPSIRVTDIAINAEALGFNRVWLYDSPALYTDVWVALARIAERTTGIGLGTAVAVPSLRHPMVTASAIATIEELAPGRLACAFGTGFTARNTMGKRAMKWRDIGVFMGQLRKLLAGEVVEIDGSACQMIHSMDFAPSRPIEVPLLLAPAGPKGFAVARDTADGVLCENAIEAGFEWIAKLVFGTVLDDGENHQTERVRQAAGPWFVTGYHALWERLPEMLQGMPGADEWLQRVEASRPENERHLAVHEGHVVAVNERDQPLLDSAGDLLTTIGWTGDVGRIREHIAQAESEGVTEIIYTPAGPDIPGELESFANAAAV